MELNSSGPPKSLALLSISFCCKIIYLFVKWSLFVVYFLIRYCYICLAFKVPLFSSLQPNNVGACLLLLCPWNAIGFTYTVWMWFQTSREENDQINTCTLKFIESWEDGRWRTNNILCEVCLNSCYSWVLESSMMLEEERLGWKQNYNE